VPMPHINIQQGPPAKKPGDYRGPEVA